MKFARGRGILCQGRGAAANSAVCYCLEITSVDPSRIKVLFERFISRARNEPPDIDVDFEHERREEVIQYIYQKYGRDRAALTAEVVSYRGRSAVREVGKALGLSLDCVNRLSKSRDWWDSGVLRNERLRELGINPHDPTIQHLIRLSTELLGFPRHLSQHVGGFVITEKPLCQLVPIENAAMEDRTVIEWDKDDIDAMGMLKMDCLGLGMLTCIRKALGFINEATKRRSDEGEEFALAIQHSLQQKEHEHDSQNVSRPHRLAKSDGSGAGDVPYDNGDASGRAVRSHRSDQESSDFRSIKHCRGTRPPDPQTICGTFGSREDRLRNWTRSTNWRPV